MADLSDIYRVGVSNPPGAAPSGGSQSPGGQSTSVRSPGGQTGSPPASMGGALHQLGEDVRSAAEAMIEEQKAKAAGAVEDLAEKLRRTGRNIDPENGPIAQYVERAANGLRGFSEDVRERRWNDLVADTEAFARRQPAVFLLGAAAIGFAIGRFISASSDRSGRIESYGPDALGSESFVARGAAASAYSAGGSPPAGGI